MRKVVLAQMTEAIRAHADTRLSDKRAENEARNHEAYRNHLAERRRVAKEHAQAEAEMYRLRNRHEVLLRQLAFKRTEMDFHRAA